MTIPHTDDTHTDNTPNTLKLVVTTARGLEGFLADELDSLKSAGLAISHHSPSRGVFELTQDKATAYTLCLWSRVAQRVLWELLSFDATSIDEIYNRLTAFAWTKHLASKQTFKIEVNTTADVRDNEQFLTYKIKDAIVDNFTRQGFERPNVKTLAPDLALYVFWDGAHVRCSIDFSGSPLHKRGYRKSAGEAPIRETLAAAMLYASGWHKVCAQSQTSQDAGAQLIDPFCGSGTLLIEAALMAWNIAPGLLRHRFGFERWQQHDDTLWQSLRKEAIDARKDRKENKPNFIIKGYDADAAVLLTAKENTLAANLEGIHYERRSIANFNARAVSQTSSPSFIITNPPYGERMGEEDVMRLFYKTIGQRFKQYAVNWTVAVISDHIEKVDAIGLDVQQTHKVFNGPLSCYLRVGTVKKEQQKPLHLPQIKELSAEQLGHEDVSRDFINRLKKNMKVLKPWFKKNASDCFRLYDGDMPEYNAAIDWYKGHWHIQEYKAPKSIDEEKAAMRFEIIVDSLKMLFAIPDNKIHLKTRRKLRGKDQYRKNYTDHSQWLTVQEHGVNAQVNLTDYMDTGLFLDHRPTRHALQSLCVNKRFLNLFCYTGMATMHAAIGNEQGSAKSSVSVDASNTYLEWAKRNLAVNGLAESDHQFIRHDCAEWLRKTHAQFDVIFLDPPTFSNSKSRHSSFDIQRDHPELIALAMKRLEADGLLIFSTNSRKFTLDDEVKHEWLCTDMTEKSMPADFRRRPAIHKCWYMRKPR